MKMFMCILYNSTILAAIIEHVLHGAHISTNDYLTRSMPCGNEETRYFVYHATVTITAIISGDILQFMYLFIKIIFK